GGGLGMYYTAYIGPPLPDDEFAAAATDKLALPGPNGDFHNSPYQYHLVFGQYGRGFTGLDRQVSRKDLATVQVDYSGEGTGRIGFKNAIGLFGGTLGFSRPISFDLPFRSTEYYLASPDLTWRNMFDVYIPGPVWDVPQAYFEQTTTYQPQHNYREQWGYPVFTPASPQVQQTRDELYVRLPLHSDGAGHQGDPATAQGTAKLYRNDTLIATRDDVIQVWAYVPPDRATYRVEVDATRDADLSIRQTGSWTFHAEDNPATRTTTTLPAVRFWPNVDAYGNAPAGREYLIPVTVGGLASGVEVDQLTVDISYDDGKTWQPARINRSGANRWNAQVRHPGGGGFVSLRATVTDTAGNSGTHATIRAYRLQA
ncbi:MAG TPA: hypothetical protein VGD43_16945, partial [Micromonospora sp.]